MILEFIENVHICLQTHNCKRYTDSKLACKQHYICHCYDSDHANWSVLVDGPTMAMNVPTAGWATTGRHWTH